MKRITINQTPSLPGGEPSRYVTEKFFIRSGDDYNCPPLVAGEVVELSDEEADSLLKVSKGFIIETSKKATRSLINLAAYQPEHPDPATAPAPPEAPQNELVELVAKLSQQMQTQTDELAAQARELRVNAQAQAALEAKLESALQDVSEDAPAPEEAPAPQEIPSVVLPVPQLESVKPTKRTRRAKE